MRNLKSLILLLFVASIMLLPKEAVALRQKTPVKLKAQNPIPLNISRNAFRTNDEYNDPIAFEYAFGLGSFEHRLNYMPHRGYSSAKLWPGWYWPTVFDSINDRVGESKSITEKYAKAYGHDPKKLMDDVSQEFGLLDASGQSCSHDADCSGGSECGFNFGSVSKRTGVCVQSWWGVCNGWAASTIFHQQPKCNVNVNGVQFTPRDVQGLLALLYTSSSFKSIFLATRCEEHNIPYDGTAEDSACFDANPGGLLVVLANVYGKYGKALLMDRSANDEVWNQPVVGFEILSIGKLYTRQQAKSVFAEETYIDFSRLSAPFYSRVSFEIYYIDEADPENGPGPYNIGDFIRTFKLNALIELKEDMTITGGEWLWDSVKNHPDFIWMPYGTPSYVSPAGLDYNKILNLADRSASC